MRGRVRRAATAALGLLFVLLSICEARAQVTSPSPADKATNVAVTTSLSWNADPRASRYDVSFGTTNPPTLVVRNQSSTTYRPSTLQPATTYYWRVDARGSKGYSSTGPVWSFTTGTPPPSPPSMPANPSPTSGSGGIAVGTTLSWTASSNASSYDVAFGTTSPPPVVSTGQVATTYQPAGALQYSQTYYWRVTAIGSGGTTAGPIWTFSTTTAPPSTSRDRLRLMTWNVQSGKNASGAVAVDAQAALMADSGADVIALQDVTITAEAGDLTTLYKSKLEALTGVAWYQIWAPDPRASGATPEGNLILSRIPILSSATTQFDSAPADPAFLDSKQSAASVVVVVNGVAVNVLTTRLAIDAGQRQQQLDLFQTWASSFQAPRVIGGSFNMVPNDAVYGDMAGSFTDVWPILAGSSESGFTQDAQTVVPNQPARVDYWFQEPVDGHARASEMWVVKTARSSHHAVLVDVNVQ